MGVSEYFERAHECAALADNMTDDEKTKMLAVAEAWPKVADEVAKEAGKANGKPRDDKA